MIEVIVPNAQQATGMTPFSSGPTPAMIVNNVFPLTPGVASSAAQIAQALLVAGSGIGRIDTFPTPAQFALANSAPIVVVPSVAGKVIVPIHWSFSKTVVVGGAQGILTLIYQGTGFGSPAASINSDSGTVRPGWCMAPAVSLTVFGANNPTGLALQMQSAADAPASNLNVRISVLFYLWTPPA